MSKESCLFCAVSHESDGVVGHVAAIVGFVEDAAMIELPSKLGSNEDGDRSDCHERIHQRVVVVCRQRHESIILHKRLDLAVVALASLGAVARVVWVVALQREASLGKASCVCR